MTSLRAFSRAALLAGGAALGLSAGIASAQDKPEGHGDTPQAKYVFSGTSPRRDQGRDPGPQAGRSGDDQGGVRQGGDDLLRALRRLPRRAAQGRDRQAADARHHAGSSASTTCRDFITYGSPAGMPNWGTSGELTEAAGRPDGALPAARAAAAAGVRHGGDEGELEGPRAARAAADQEDEQPRHRQPVLGDAARRRRGRADRRRHQEDRQHLQDRLRGAHLAHVGLGALSVRRSAATPRST